LLFFHVEKRRAAAPAVIESTTIRAALLRPLGVEAPPIAMFEKLKEEYVGKSDAATDATTPSAGRPRFPTASLRGSAY